MAKSKPKGKPESGGAVRPADGGKRMGKSEYYDRLAPLELELNDMARWLQHTGQRVVVLLEGRDTAGKGGVINAIASTLNPRQCRTVALPKPTERERTQWYFQRYVPHLPAAGEIVLFDRSWYNRAGVERVMGYCSDEQAQAFLEQAPVFEKMLVDDGILLFKYWLTVDQALQEERFAERRADPLKRWKLSPVDVEARARYADYMTARGHPRQAHAVDAGGLQRPAPRPAAAHPPPARCATRPRGARGRHRLPAAAARAAEGTLQGRLQADLKRAAALAAPRHLPAAPDGRARWQPVYRESTSETRCRCALFFRTCPRSRTPTPAVLS
jgi:polyphosphate kinase